MEEQLAIPEPAQWQRMVAEAEARLGFPICAARNRALTPCENKAGKGTDHLGEGRCKFHGGKNQTPLAKNWKHGKFAQIKTQHPALRAKMEEIAGDHQVFELEQEILKMRGMIEIMLDQDDLLAAARMIVDLSKVVERLHNIQVGRRYVISIENVSIIIETVKDVIIRHVPDEYTRAKIATDLNNLRLASGASSPKYIEGEVLSEA